jgi:hypothetical protein
MTKEQRVRAYGAHLGLITRGPRGGPFRLAERYPPKRELGTYRSAVALERGIDRYSDRTLRELGQRPPPRRSQAQPPVRWRLRGLPQCTGGLPKGTSPGHKTAP